MIRINNGSPAAIDREKARNDDDLWLITAVADGTFEWENRYDAAYICGIAREFDQNQGRLKKAIERMDVKFREHMRQAEKETAKKSSWWSL